jgi:hypothetical protein
MAQNPGCGKSNALRRFPFLPPLLLPPRLGRLAGYLRPLFFGEFLGAIMEARGIPAEPAEIRELAERSGFDGDAFLALATSEDAPDVGPLSGLDREMRRRDMELTGPERVALAEAYLFGRDDADEGTGG